MKTNSNWFFAAFLLHLLSCASIYCVSMADQSASTSPAPYSFNESDISAEPQSSTPNIAKKSKKTQKPRSERDQESKAVPDRSPLKMYTQDDRGRWVDSLVKNDGVRSQDFQTSNNKRVASRGGWYEALARDALRLKTVCNDNGKIIIEKWPEDKNHATKWEKYGSLTTVFSMSTKENLHLRHLLPRLWVPMTY